MASTQKYTENREEVISSSWSYNKFNIVTHSGMLESNKQCIFGSKSHIEPIKSSLWLGLDQT